MASIEICVDSLASALAAEQGGAQRIELCSALREGGVTPSLGLLRAVRARTAVTLHVLIRPRAGDFLYTDDEFQIMREDIAVTAQAGADGVVFGILTAGADVDEERTAALVATARPLQVTFHRAFDMTRDPEDALRSVIRCGADRVLTSGAEPTAMLGRQRLRSLVESAASRIGVMVGGGVRPANVATLAQATGAVEFHSSLRRTQASPMQITRDLHLGDAGVDEYTRMVVLAEDVRALVAAAGATTLG